MRHINTQDIQIEKLVDEHHVDGSAFIDNIQKICERSRRFIGKALEETNQDLVGGYSHSLDISLLN